MRVKETKMEIRVDSSAAFLLAGRRKQNGAGPAREKRLMAPGVSLNKQPKAPLLDWPGLSLAKVPQSWQAKTPGLVVLAHVEGIM